MKKHKKQLKISRWSRARLILDITIELQLKTRSKIDDNNLQKMNKIDD